MIRPNLRAPLFLAALLVATPAPGDEPPPASRAEIQHLLGYLGESGCRFFRNGSWHPAADARGHVERKYAVLVRRGAVKTAEDFIAHAAAESSTSGEPYLVRCGDARPTTSARWLEAELARYRKLGPARK